MEDYQRKRVGGNGYCWVMMVEKPVLTAEIGKLGVLVMWRSDVW